MKLTECKKFSKVEVTKLEIKGDLKQRLISFGVIKEAIVEVLEYSPAKATIEIQVGKMKIALRANEAESIMVKEI